MSADFLEAALRGLSRNVAFTSPAAEDPRLRGRTYAIPFEQVWQAATELAGGGLKRWEVHEADDQEGIVRGVARGWFGRLTSSVTIRITLDRDAQTRVDAMCAARFGRADLGLNSRRLRRFFRELDRRLAETRGSATIQPFRIDLQRHLAGRP